MIWLLVFITVGFGAGDAGAARGCPADLRPTPYAPQLRTWLLFRAREAGVTGVEIDEVTFAPDVLAIHQFTPNQPTLTILARDLAWDPYSGTVIAGRFELLPPAAPARAIGTDVEPVAGPDPKAAYRVALDRLKRVRDALRPPPRRGQSLR